MMAYQFSNICEGASMKSPATLIGKSMMQSKKKKQNERYKTNFVPWNREYVVLLNSSWKIWPISWKNDTTSSCFIRAGLSGVGFAKFATSAADG